MVKHFGIVCAVICCSYVAFAQQNTHTVTIPVKQLQVNTFTPEQMRQILERDQARVRWINSRIQQADDEAAEAEGKLSHYKFNQFKESLIPKGKTLDEIRKQIGLPELNYPF